MSCVEWSTMADLLVERPRPEIALVTLNRPARLNALSFDLVDELHETFDTLDADNSCRVIVLTGAGRGFCAGLDLKSIAPSSRSTGAHGNRSAMLSQSRIANLIIRMRRIQQPIVAAVNGPAYGGGFALALSSDLRVASDTARFCTQFIKLGLSGCDVGVSYLLPRLVGGARAHELMLTARELGAAEAKEIGLVVDVVPAADVVDRALALAETLLNFSPFGVAMTKEVMWANLDAPSIDAAVHLENRTQILAGTGGEIEAAAAAFAEGRPPIWPT
jgi:enoyl-CoA hydratase